MLRTPTLAGARVPKKPTISFQFFAASPRPPSAFERSGKEMVGFFRVRFITAKQFTYTLCDLAYSFTISP